MHLLRYFFALGAAIVLAGCMQDVQTQVDAYSSVPTDLEPRTVFVAPYQGMNARDLEWQSNARTLAAVLGEKGYQVVARQRDARLTAYFGFGVDQGEQVQTSYSIPQFGVTGYSGARTFGTVYGNTYSGTTTLQPTYGVTGYNTGVRTETVFTRSVAIDMIDNRTRGKVFQARAVSRGSCNSFAPVAVNIIGAVLSNFPQGRTGTVTDPMKGEC